MAPNTISTNGMSCGVQLLRKAKLTDTSQELVGGKYTRQVIDTFCKLQGIPELTPIQWTILVDWCKELDETADLKDEATYVLENMDRLEADLESYKQTYFDTHGKTWEEKNGEGS
jgi:hypothetical protein